MSRWSRISFAGDADHFPARMGLTLFVIGEAARNLVGHMERMRVIESSAYDLGYARNGRGLG